MTAPSSLDAIYEDPFHPSINGLRLPAEWEPQKSVWFTWPQNEATWAPVREESYAAYRTFIAEALRFTDVCLLCDTPRLQEKLTTDFAAAVHAGGHQLNVLICKTNDSWIRDYGALTALAPDGRPVSVDFRFNSWGGKYPPWDSDDAVGTFMARHRGHTHLPLSMVLEGGSIDVNGRGLLLTTRQCLLNKNRNPQFNQDQIETILRNYLGTEHTLWLGQGIDGDDTDGHVDDLSRFTDPQTVATAIEHNAHDENYAALKANARELERHAVKHGLQVVEIPMPKKLEVAGLRVPATYLNFLIINGAVLQPVFLDRLDDSVCAQMQALFPDRRIVPFDARHLVFGQGAVHCSSMQEAASGSRT